MGSRAGSGFAERGTRVGSAVEEEESIQPKCCALDEPEERTSCSTFDYQTARQVPVGYPHSGQDWRLSLDGPSAPFARRNGRPPSTHCKGFDQGQGFSFDQPSTIALPLLPPFPERDNSICSVPRACFFQFGSIRGVPLLPPPPAHDPSSNALPSPPTALPRSTSSGTGAIRRIWTHAAGWQDWTCGRGRGVEEGEGATGEEGGGKGGEWAEVRGLGLRGVLRS